jgi:hypothetical protein
MKFSGEKIALLFIPYLLMLSIFYNNGYWSFFSFSVFNYYEAQDIAKDIAGPLFKFGGLLIVPLFLAALTTASMFNSKKVTDAADEKARKELKKEWKKLSFIRKVVYILKVIGYIILGIAAFLVAVFLITIICYPIEDDGGFIIKYINTLQGYSVVRLLYLTLFVLIGSSFVVKRLRSISEFDGVKIGVILMSIVLTAVVAYHYGRIEAYKIISGTNFRYWIDKKGVGHKYMSKINKNYIFLNDAGYINPSGNDYALDTIGFDPRITVISEDSLKSVELGYFGPNMRDNGETFRKIFVSRNGGKEF